MKEIRKKQKQQTKKNSRKVRFYYSFLTVVLIICLVQVTRSAVLNITKTLNYKVKVRKMMVLRQEVEQQHERLESDIKNFGNLKSLEAIARNNLKLAGENETLVIINKETPKPVEIQEVPEADEITQEQPTNTKPSWWERFKNHNRIKNK